MPGLVGGHCIGVDPYYLIHKAQELGYDPQLIINSRRVNNEMSKYIADITVKEMIQSEVNIKDAEVLMLGITFKENCPDMRNTKVIDLIDELKEFGCNVDVFDPWVDIDAESSWYKHGMVPDPLKSDKKYDSIIIAVAHDQFKEYTKGDLDRMSKRGRIVIDIKGISKAFTWRL
jgi:UDP-N-acetyl-D-galactosamine dehydrogenase